MAWVATAMVGGATLSYMSSSAANAKIGSIASSNLASSQALASQNYDVTTSQLQDKAQELNNSLGMELTNLIYSSVKSQAQGTTVLAERNVYGTTANRLLENVNMKTELTKDQLIQSAESKLVDIQNNLRNAKYSYESGNIQSGINYNNTMMQQQSSTEMIAGSLSTGLSMGAAAHTLSKG